MVTRFYACITPERYRKTNFIMRAMQGSFVPKPILKIGEPPDGEPFFVWGHDWLGGKLVPNAVERGTPFYFIDNGFYRGARGGKQGYYSVTYRWLNPMMIRNPDLKRLPVRMPVWRKQRGDTILLCMPGKAFGKMFNWDMEKWKLAVITELKKHTDRKIVVREKGERIPLAVQLNHAHVVVTHTSKVAVDAVLTGVPVICERTCPAYPVSGNSLSQVEKPPMSDRNEWWHSLMCQQFTLDELRSSRAQHYLLLAQAQGDRFIKPGIPKFSELVNVA